MITKEEIEIAKGLGAAWEKHSLEISECTENNITTDKYIFSVGYNSGADYVLQNLGPVLHECKKVILEGFTKRERDHVIYTCQHDWEPDTTMTYMRCDKCYVGRHQWEFLEKLRELRGDK